MSQKSKNNQGSGPRLAASIEYALKNWKFRLVAVILLLAIGMYFIGSAVTQLLTKDTGWREIEADKVQSSCATQFSVVYDLGASGVSATAEYKQLSILFNEAAQKAYRLFSGYETFDGVVNLRTLSDRPNEVLTVEPELYAALEKIVRCGSRLVYLAPVYGQYFSLFHSEDDYQAESFDPFTNEDVAKFFAEVAKFASDKNQIDLQLLGENRVKLFVSESYLQFAREQEIDRFLDLFWMEQAFQADLIADAFVSRGFTNGIVTGSTGFSRVLDERPGSTYQTSILTYNAGFPQIAGQAVLQGKCATVYFRDYRLASDLTFFSYQFVDTSLRSAFVNPSTGLCQSATHDLLGYSKDAGCAEVALALADVYIADELEENALRELTKQGIFTAYTQGKQIICSDSGVKIADLNANFKVTYLE